LHQSHDSTSAAKVTPPAFPNRCAFAFIAVKAAGGWLIVRIGQHGIDDHRAGFIAQNAISGACRERCADSRRQPADVRGLACAAIESEAKSVRAGLSNKE
jgi:hypothetical protein